MLDSAWRCGGEPLSTQLTRYTPRDAQVEHLRKLVGFGQNIDHLDVRSQLQSYDMEIGLSIDRLEHRIHLHRPMGAEEV